MALCQRFGSSDYEDFDEALAKLQHTEIVREYQVNFEKLATHINGWPEKALVGSFNKGLKGRNRRDVKIFKPTTILALDQKTIKLVIKKPSYIYIFSQGIKRLR